MSQIQQRSDSMSHVWRCESGVPIYPLTYDCTPRSLPVKLANERYRLVGGLGSGSFGSVMMAKVRRSALKIIKEEMSLSHDTLLEPIKESGKTSYDLVAIKILNRKLTNLQDYSKVKEVKFILSVTSHQNLVQVYDLFVDKASFKLHIVMEALDQNLYQLLKARKGSLFSSGTLKSILSQILAAIRHIHRCHFFHRDVKPENILVMPTVSFYGSKESVPPLMRKDSYVVKLADYGLARHISNTKPFTAYVSTRWYRSPEILLRNKSYSFPVDIWAFGCVAVEAATFTPLLPGQNELDQTWKVLELLGYPEKTSSDDLDLLVTPPLGGYWEDAQLLASNLGFCLPKLPGSTIHNVLPRKDIERSERHELYKVIQSCLLWDPKLRGIAEKLAQSSYFDCTVLRTEDAKLNKVRRDFQNSLTNLEVKFDNEESTKIPLPEVTSDTIFNDENKQEPSEVWQTKLKRLPHITMDMFRIFKQKSESSNDVQRSISTEEESVPSLEEEPYEEFQGRSEETGYFDLGINSSLKSRLSEALEFENTDGERLATTPIEKISPEDSAILREKHHLSNRNESQLPTVDISSYNNEHDIIKGSRNQNLIDTLSYSYDQNLNEYENSFYDWTTTQ
ncbi:hypothetical protein FOA43_000203 [Brettanomyces nanus]|uniref:Protein kinase domain-containing protein n=1 Tax=Eeniella nana TaxID=13502 RepID=A0A875RMY5_EENNA|nr:uncharacterized protein FOA43_000203 [Brettanomyces nanus]QPG72900.1 hypothetical protein FOA43_000203 [Brettanomyces nanus]